MIEARRGAVVWVLTTATIGAPPKQMSAYASGKMAALGLMRCLAAEYASKGIRFNAVSPGFTETPLTATTPAEVRELYRKAIPMGRLASPEDTASAVSYLVSEGSAFVTGVNLPVCGGAVML
jgi:NAD(P)-dependent dehydrogenase (short-subunit alcohol dehydrogenase family)